MMSSNFQDGLWNFLLGIGIAALMVVVFWATGHVPFFAHHPLAVLTSFSGFVAGVAITVRLRLANELASVADWLLVWLGATLVALLMVMTGLAA